MKKYLIYLSILFILFKNNSSFANEYIKYANELREKVWKWDISSFHNYTIPDEYKNESVIIMAHHQQIEAIAKKNFRHNSTGMDMKRVMFYIHIDRKMVKLNDNKALEEYSEISFKEEIISVKNYGLNKIKTVVGVRIIKPDGSINEIDVDADIVSITKGKNDLEAYKKLTIKNLEVGDIIDYFYCEDMDLETLNVPSHTFSFYSQYPTLYYSIECIFGNKLTVEYRSINGAPNFEKYEDEDKNTILKVSQNNLKTSESIKNLRWISPYRDLPMIRLVVLNNFSHLIYKPTSARISGIYEDVAYENILKDAKNIFAKYSGTYIGAMSLPQGRVKMFVRNYKLNVPEATKEDLANYIYDALRFNWPNYMYSKYDTKNQFYIILNSLFKYYGIESKICFTTNRYGARQNEVVESIDLSSFVSANDNKQLFFFPDGYRAAGEIPAMYEGENVSAILVKKYHKTSKVGIIGTTSEFKIPESKFIDNKNKITSNVIFSNSNPLELKIDRNTISFGNNKDNYIDMFLLYEDWDKHMRKRLFVETDFWQDLATDTYSRHLKDQYETFFDDERKKQKEFINQEFKEFHSTNSGELINFDIKSIGTTVDKPYFEYQIEYTIDGLVKKAGNDLILDAGKLIGAQWIPSEKERKRDIDSYLSAASIIENEILITIPEQYKLEGIESLNKEIDNDVAKFSSTASFENGVLKISVTKVYKSNFVSKDDWDTLLKMIDKANEFYSQSVVLKYSPQ